MTWDMKSQNSATKDRRISKTSRLENAAARRAQRFLRKRAERIFTPHRKGRKKINDHHKICNRGINGILIQWIGQMARDEWS